MTATADPGSAHPRLLPPLSKSAVLEILLWVAGTEIALLSLRLVVGVGVGWDAHAYYIAWHGTMYDRSPGAHDAYLYSPAFAQVIRPLTQLPWPVFLALCSAGSAACFTWLLAPLGWRLAIPLWLCCVPEILSGNIYALLAVVAVIGLSRAELWVIPALTKVTPALGPLWFLLRGEWRRLVISLSAIAAVSLLSAAVNPDLWAEWLGFLASYAKPSHGFGTPEAPPLIVRAPLALGLLAWGARTDRRWALPLAMALITPVFAPESLTVIAAIPRLRAGRHRPTTRDRRAIGVSGSDPTDEPGQGQ